MRRVFIFSFSLFWVLLIKAPQAAEYGFQGTEFDNQVAAYGVGEIDDLDDIKSLIYGLEIWKTIDTGKVTYRVSLQIIFIGDYRNYKTVTKRGGRN